MTSDFDIVWKKSAAKELQGLDQTIRGRVMAAIANLETESFSKSVSRPTISPSSGSGIGERSTPNPHQEEISVDLLSRILRQAGIQREQWLTGKRPQGRIKA